jgi:2-oxoglutarate ferredoxin oxidoreductase subunit gamma
MNLPSFHKFEPKVKPGGTLVVNSSLISSPFESRRPKSSFYLDTAEVAKELGNPVLAGMVALGALNEAIKLVETESLEAALKKLLARSSP